MLVVRAHSNSGIACAINDTRDDALVPVHFRKSVGRALAGDRVRVDGAGAVAEILPRRNLFGRGAWKGGFQPVAANLDRLLIMLAPEPAPTRDLLHRYLAAAHILGIEPCILINKADLPCADLEAYLESCRIPDTPIVSVSAVAGGGLDELRELLSGKISLLTGQSGVGKTSLVNALIPDLSKQTAALSRVTGKGTHATSTCELHRLPDEGWLGDSPGVWEYHLWKMAPRELERGFPEFSALPETCRFNDCKHGGEPGCAVAAAVAAGALPRPRLEAWRRLLKETNP